MKKYLFFDNASTTKCSDAAAETLQRFSVEKFGNPSSGHVMGQQAARAIHDAHVAFAGFFRVNPEQVIFTSSGSEANNMAIYGLAMDQLARRRVAAPRVICSAIEHPAVRKTMESLASLGFDVQLAPVNSQGQVLEDRLLELVTPSTLLVSIMQVNNIVGVVQPVEELARKVKSRAPAACFHSDAVQAFGKVNVPSAPSAVDLVSISGHKVEGPKGVGALVVLNKQLLKEGMRPLIWGGGQENGWRSGTQNAGLIAGFRLAAEQAWVNRERTAVHVRQLRTRLEQQLRARNLLGDQPGQGRILWNSPADSVPHIVSLAIPGLPSGPLAKMLEERGVILSTGSACSSKKPEPDYVLAAMGLPPQATGSAIRASFSGSNTLQEVDALVAALHESLQLMSQLLGGKPF